MVGKINWQRVVVAVVVGNVYFVPLAELSNDRNANELNVVDGGGEPDGFGGFAIPSRTKRAAVIRSRR